MADDAKTVEPPTIAEYFNQLASPPVPLEGLNKQYREFAVAKIEDNVSEKMTGLQLTRFLKEMQPELSAGTTEAELGEALKEMRIAIAQRDHGSVADIPPEQLANLQNVRGTVTAIYDIVANAVHEAHGKIATDTGSEPDSYATTETLLRVAQIGQPKAQTPKR
jgi:hypothetical protein